MNVSWNFRKIKRVMLTCKKGTSFSDKIKRFFAVSSPDGAIKLPYEDATKESYREGVPMKVSV